jgi:predicted AlkP superfamily phosphohydrolase/phosphomutase
VVIIGLDSVPPALAFEQFAEQMPNLGRIRSRGRWGPLRSTDPPITVPAWAAMTTGRDPGELGIYGFRNREPGTYGMRLVGAADLSFPRIWNLASDAGLSSAVVSVPPTYPPRAVASPRTWITGCFLTPGADSPWAEPASLREELSTRFGSYIVDAEAHRSADRSRLLAECRELTRQHFAIFRHLLETRRPDFAMIVDLGPDRFHHGLLADVWPEHPRYDPTGPFARAGAKYYALLDREIGSCLELLDPEALVLVVSDHGVRPLTGGVCINEWLIDEGYLVLEERPREPTPLARCRVDWGRTRAWGEGGYHGRVLFNVAGREPCGLLPHAQLDAEREHLAERAAALPGPDGRPMQTRVLFPERIYRRVRGTPPDLMVYWDGLSRRSVGSVGHGALHVERSDTGPDHANHDPDGIYAACGPGIEHSGERLLARIADVFATAVEALGIEPPRRAGGRSLMGETDVV